MCTHLGVPCSPCAAAEREEGSPFHLSAAVSCGAALVQHSRRTKRDWFMAGARFMWSRSGGLCRISPSQLPVEGLSSLTAAGVRGDTHTGVSPEPERLTSLSPGGLSCVSLS